MISRLLQQMIGILLALSHPTYCITFIFGLRLDGHMSVPVLRQVRSQASVQWPLLALLTLSYRGLALVQLLINRVSLIESIALLE